ncbi:hypothetical protein DMI62_04230 [Escherichia coli]|nr:hypothetical protein [Escherichia coli]
MFLYPLNRLSGAGFILNSSAQPFFQKHLSSAIACVTVASSASFIHGSCISVRPFYIRTAPLATSVQYAIRRIYTFPHWLSTS